MTASTDRSASGPCSTRRGVVVAGASTHPGKFGFVALHNILASGYAGTVFATNREGTAVLGVDTVPDDRRPARRRGRPRVRVHAGGDQPRPAARRRGQGHPGRLPDVGRLRRGRRGGPGAPRTSWSRWPTSSACSSSGPNGQGVVSTPSSLCAQIVAPVPAGRAHRHRQPVRQLRVVVHELRPRQRRRHQPRRVGRQRGAGRRRRLPRASTPTIPRPTSALAYVEGVADGRAFFERLRAVCRADARRARQGRRHVGRRSAPRPATPARWPPTTGSSTACAGRPAWCGPARSRRPTRWRPPSPPNRCPPGPASRSSPPPADGASSPPTPSPAPTSSCWRCPTT